MMSEMGKKRNIKIFSAVIAAIFVFSVAGLAIMQTGNRQCAPSSNIGVVDTSKIITPDNQDAVAAQKQLQQAGEDMQKQFEQQSAGMDDQQKQQLFQKCRGTGHETPGNFQGIKDKVDNAVSDVAKTKGLSLVVDKSVVLYGGTDITNQVAKELNKNSSSSSSDSSSSNSSSSDSSSSNQ